MSGPQTAVGVVTRHWFRVPGRPVPAVRMTQSSKWTDTQAQRYLAYKARVGWLAKEAGIVFVPKPTGVSLSVDIWYAGDVMDKGNRKFDVDNVLKAIKDALNGVAYHDDWQVRTAHVRLHAAADRAHEYVEVQVYSW